MDEQQSKDMNKENNGNTGNMTEENNPHKDFETNEDSLVNTEDSIDGTETKATQKNDKNPKIFHNSKLVEKSMTQLAIPNTDKLDNETQIMNDSLKKMSGNNSNSQIMKSPKKSFAIKRSRDDKKKHKKHSKKRKISNNNEGREKPYTEEEVQNDKSISSEQTTANTVTEHDNTDPYDNLPLENASSSITSKKSRKKSRKEKTKKTSDDVSQQLCLDINRKLDWIKEHVGGLETFVSEKLTEISENWKQVGHTQSTSAGNNTGLDISNINRPPAVGYVRVDNNTIHLGQGIWLPKQTYCDVVFSATTNAMFVKNIAMAVYGAQYLKEHSVKGKACNKTKSKPRPAIDIKKALAIKEIYEYYLKENKRFTEEEEAEEANNYEDYIRGKICDLRRPRTSSKNKKKDNETQSSSRGSGNGSDSGGGGSGSDSGGDSDSGSGNGSCSDDSEEEPSNQKKDNTTPSV
ncbi:uncharacterized protein LOC123274110 isoform X4 [Cotesia glomerata]|nr:uncharacterized protein LOC123274110 isoform X4 [Cotesia glomerata]